MSSLSIDPLRMEAQIAESADLIRSLTAQSGRLVEISRAIVTALRNGGQVLTAGNGGSAAEALHMAEELIGRFRSDRPSLPGLALVADSTAITCISNDFGYDCVFSRQVEGLGRSEASSVPVARRQPSGPASTTPST